MSNLDEYCILKTNSAVESEGYLHISLGSVSRDELFRKKEEQSNKNLDNKPYISTKRTLFSLAYNILIVNCNYEETSKENIGRDRQTFYIYKIPCEYPDEDRQRTLEIIWELSINESYLNKYVPYANSTPVDINQFRLAKQPKSGRLYVLYRYEYIEEFSDKVKQNFRETAKFLGRHIERFQIIVDRGIRNFFEANEEFCFFTSTNSQFREFRIKYLEQPKFSKESELRLRLDHDGNWSFIRKYLVEDRFENIKTYMKSCEEFAQNVRDMGIVYYEQ